MQRNIELKTLLREEFGIYKLHDTSNFFLNFLERYDIYHSKYGKREIFKRLTTYQYIGLIHNCKLEEEFKYYLDEQIFLKV